MSAAEALDPGWLNGAIEAERELRNGGRRHRIPAEERNRDAVIHLLVA